jgi:hypothetical protein
MLRFILSIYLSKTSIYLSKAGWGYSSVVEHILSMGKILGSERVSYYLSRLAGNHNPPTIASRRAGTTEVYHHTQLVFKI